MEALTELYDATRDSEVKKSLQESLDRYDTVRADGTVKNSAKAHSWKANYHDVRAIVKFVEAFAR